MRTILLLLLLLAPAALAQTVTVQDESASDSPITFSPGANVSEHQEICAFSAHSNDTRNIVAYVVRTKMLRPDGTFHHSAITLHDHFLSQNHTMPGDFVINAPCHNMETNISLIFVQFADGAIWGDKTEIMQQRSDVLAYLKTLQSANKSGPTVFRQVLDQKTGGGGPGQLPQLEVLTLQSQLQKAQDMSASLAKKLAAAQAHAAWLK